MFVAHLSLADFRSYAAAEVGLEPGVTVFIGPNGEGKTNLVEAVGYLAQHGSHRVASDTPLVRHGASRAIVRGLVHHEDRRALIELEINPGKANRARLNRSPVSRPREVLGMLRSVLFAPEDLALVKGDPGERRRFLDELLVARSPRFAAVRSDYDRVLKQRNALLKSAAGARSRGPLPTLDVWDAHLAEAGATLLTARLELVSLLGPRIAKAYAALAPSSGEAVIEYVPSVEELDRTAVASSIQAALTKARPDELDRGITLIGPHRDELRLRLGDLPARGYASQGESWSFALSLRLAAYDLLRADGGDPVLVLDDVFAELDSARRSRLAEFVSQAEQVLVTAAVPDDVPAQLTGVRYEVSQGEVVHVR